MLLLLQLLVLLLLQLLLLLLLNLMSLIIIRYIVNDNNENYGIDEDNYSDNNDDNDII